MRRSSGHSLQDIENPHILHAKLRDWRRWRHHSCPFPAFKPCELYRPSHLQRNNTRGEERHLVLNARHHSNAQVPSCADRCAKRPNPIGEYRGSRLEEAGEKASSASLGEMRRGLWEASLEPSRSPFPCLPAGLPRLYSARMILIKLPSTLWMSNFSAQSLCSFGHVIGRR